MPAPRFLGNSTLLGEPKPINWKGVGQALWEANLNPLRGPYELMNTPAETLLYDTGPAAEKAAGDTFFTALDLTGGSALAPKPSNALTMGIKAYHGSPHSFEKFEWSPKTRGTGEGAQAYGDGLYFAEQEDIARSYRDALSPKKVAIGGEMVDSPTFFKAARRSPSVDDNIAMLTKQRENILKEQSQYTGDPELGDFVGELYDTQLKDVDREIAELSQYKGGWFGTRPGGSMYEVNIDADPNAFLDWDKPLSEQPEAVRDALKKLSIDTGSMTAKDRVETINAALQGDPRLAHLLGKNGINITGDTLYKGLSDSLGATDWPVTADAATRAQYRSKGATNATQALKEAGIPGIKFLDAGSRVPSAMAKKELADWQAQLPLAKKELADATARGDKWLISRKQDEVQRVKDGISRVSQEADGTRNYVVFDDKLISIVKKYGIAGASAMLGYNVMTGANEAQAKAVNKADLDHRYDNFLKSGGI